MERDELLDDAWSLLCEPTSRLGSVDWQTAVTAWGERYAEGEKPRSTVLEGAEAAALPVGSWVIRCVSFDDPTPDADARPVPIHKHTFGLPLNPHRVLYRATAAPTLPEPALAVGDEVTTAAELDRLPADSVIRDADGDVAVRIDDGDWWVNGDPTPPTLPARVLDLPTGGAS